jgi:hypothetical protein
MVSLAPGIKSNSGPGNRYQDFYIETTMIFKLVAFKRTIRKLLNTLAVNFEGISITRMLILHTFCINVPLKGRFTVLRRFIYSTLRKNDS